MNNNIIGLKEQLVKIDDQIFSLAEKYQHRALSMVMRGWVVMSEHEKVHENYAKLQSEYQ
jgi:hypothetical protein